MGLSVMLELMKKRITCFVKFKVTCELESLRKWWSFTINEDGIQIIIGSSNNILRFCVLYASFFDKTIYTIIEGCRRLKGYPGELWSE